MQLVIGATYYLKQHGTVKVLDKKGTDGRIPVKCNKGHEARFPPRYFDGASMALSEKSSDKRRGRRVI